MTTIIYAWATPAFVEGSPVDHTWVTTYDNRQHAYPNDQAVVAAGASYWYCWGDFHPSAGTPESPSGALGQKAGDLAIAGCLVAPNADSRVMTAARGTIFTYGVDGVCHQLANQVLYATGTVRSGPLTVSPARGYWASVFVYGTYGLQHSAWVNKQGACSGQIVQASAPQRALGAALKSAGPFGPKGPGMSNPIDDFAARAQAVLGKTDPKKLADLLSLRADTHRFAAQRWPGLSAPGAEALNARNQHLIDQAAALLGPDHFQKIFGLDPRAKLTLVDPKMVTTPGGDTTPRAIFPGGRSRPKKLPKSARKAKK
jgi:hypothetical protein